MSTLGTVCKHYETIDFRMWIRWIAGCVVMERRRGRGVCPCAKRNRSAEFKELGLRPLIGDVTNPSSIAGQLPECDTVLIAIGMDRSKYSDIRTV